MPVWVAHNHGATTRLQITDSGGTHIRWHATFRPRVPGTGWILERYMRRTFAQVVNRLAHQARMPKS